MKDNFFAEQVEAFFIELQHESLRNLRKVDAEYNDWKKAQIELGEKYEAMLGELPHGDRELIENYIDNTTRITGREREWVYLQGFKDCIKLLRLFGVLN